MDGVMELQGLYLNNGWLALESVDSQRDATQAKNCFMALKIALNEISKSLTVIGIYDFLQTDQSLKGLVPSAEFGIEGRFDYAFVEISNDSLLKLKAIRHKLGDIPVFGGFLEIRTGWGGIEASKVEILENLKAIDALLRWGCFLEQHHHRVIDIGCPVSLKYWNHLNRKKKENFGCTNFGNDIDSIYVLSKLGLTPIVADGYSINKDTGHALRTLGIDRFEYHKDFVNDNDYFTLISKCRLHVELRWDWSFMGGTVYKAALLNMPSIASPTCYWQNELFENWTAITVSQALEVGRFLLNPINDKEVNSMLKKAREKVLQRDCFNPEYHKQLFNMLFH